MSLVEIPVRIGFSYMAATHCCVLEYLLARVGVGVDAK